MWWCRMIDLRQFHGGVHVAGHKDLSCEMAITPAPIPPQLILPLLQHIGEPTKPIVTVGDKVLKGQIIAHCRAQDCSLLMSAPVHASTSGTVVAIESRAVPHPSGLNATCIVIETDGQDQWIERLPMLDYAEKQPAEVRAHIARAGVVGLGGAGFPAHMKLRPQGIDTLIINGAECEPYITCDDRLMREYPQDIIAGAQILMHILGGAQRCIIAVEDNKPQAYQALLAATQAHIEIVQVPTLYPTGGERQLIKILTNKEISKNNLPASIGIIVHNIETSRAIYRAVNHGQPLISRVLTVTGQGVENPKNLEVLLGTPIHELLKYCKVKPTTERLIMGGAMMGFTLPNDEMPVIKTTNCLIAATAEECVFPTEAMPCIRCGACAEVCPVNLLPQQLYWYTIAKDFNKAQDYYLFDCIDCGCCAYVCPSHIPLVSYYRYAKAEIRASGKEQQKAELARKRHEFRTFRLERDKAERALRHQQRGEHKQSIIKAVMEQAKEKMAEQSK